MLRIDVITDDAAQLKWITKRLRALGMTMNASWEGHITSCDNPVTVVSLDGDFTERIKQEAYPPRYTDGNGISHVGLSDQERKGVTK